MVNTKLSKGAMQIQPFKVMRISDLARDMEIRGQTIVHFEIGEPDFPTAVPIIERAKKTLDKGLTKYTAGNGIFELREKISDYYSRFSINVDPKQIILTNGASGGLLLLVGGLLNPGDKLLSVDPGYPCNGAFLTTIGGHLKAIQLSAHNDFQPRISDFKESWEESVKGMLLASPMNPTGTVIARENLNDLNELSEEKNGFLMVDEIYQGILHKEVPYHSALEISKEIYILNSFSKYFGMTGWRLGWIVVPASTVEHFIKLAQHLFISPNTISQHAAIEALSEACLDIHESRVKIISERLKVLSRGLQEMGFVIPVEPDGGFYLFVDISHTGLDSEEFCSRILREFGVAITPAFDFSEHYSDDYVRFSCSTDLDSINLGLDRINLALKSWGV